MKLLGHLDPVVLELELLSRMRRASASGEPAAILVIVPTTRLAEHLTRRLAESRRAWLGVEILHFRHLAFRILEQAGERPLRVASSRMLEALLRLELARASGGPWSQTVADRPGTARQLAATLADLREAGVSANELTAAGPSPELDALGGIYRAYDEALSRIESRGWSDDAGLARAATPHARGFARRFGAIFVHGLYEVIGVQRDLLAELDRQTEVTVLLPASPAAPVATYARRHAETHLAPGSVIEPLADAPPIEQRFELEALYDEERKPRPAAPERFHLRHAQGEASEVTFAVRHAMRAIAEGVPPREIALVARSLSRYAAAIEEALGDAGLAWSSSLASPLRRHPLVRDYLLLLGTLADDFPRQPTAELLRSTHVDWSSVLPADDLPDGASAERLSRQARLIGGQDEWTTAFTAWADQVDDRYAERDPAETERRSQWRRATVGRIARAIRALAEQLPREPARWAVHADRFEDLGRRLVPTPDDDDARTAADQLGMLLEEMRFRETVLGDRREVSLAEARRALEDAVDRTEVLLHRRDNGGVRVLDAMQLRGQTFRRVHLLGMNAGLFPRAPREDPLLGDALRRSLAERTGRPIPVKTEGYLEERLLLALLLGSAQERIDLSWQRADESGRARTPSLALREVARVAFGAPHRDSSREQHLPSHPAHWLAKLLEDTGLLAPGEEALLTALESGDTAIAAEALAGRDELAPGLELLRSTQAWVAADGHYDGRVGPGFLPDELSVSSLELLGRCPLRFFFRQVLKVRELDEPASLFNIDHREMGLRVHGVLERVYRTLTDQGAFDGPVDALLRRAAKLVADESSALLGRLDTGLARRLPVLHEQITSRWLGTLQSFVALDLEWLSERGYRPIELEYSTVGTLDLGSGQSLRLGGRFDRRVEGKDGLLIGDYKASLRLERKPADMLKGKELQVPLYRMLAGDAARVELLGVHPDLDYDHQPCRETFVGFGDPRQERGFQETLRIIKDVAERGCFTFREGSCAWCPYDRACRRHHPPTVEREEQADDAARFRRLERKSTKQPTLGPGGEGPRS